MKKFVVMQTNSMSSLKFVSVNNKLKDMSKFSLLNNLLIRLKRPRIALLRETLRKKRLKPVPVEITHAIYHE